MASGWGARAGYGKRPALVVVDVQEGFRKAIPDFEDVARKTATLVEGARAGVYRVEVEGAIVGEAVASKEGRLRFKADSPEGQAIAAAEKSGLDISVVAAEE